MVFFNCWEDCQKQSSFSSAKLFSLEELENQGVLEGITFSVSTVGNISPKTALFSNEVYLYANIKGSSIPQPLEAIPRNLTTSEERPAQIAVGERIFYDKVRICQNAHVTTTTFGESFSLTIRGDGSPAKVNYRNSTKIRTLSVDLDFMLAYISQGAFQYNGINFPFDKTGTDLSKFSLKDEVKRLTYIKKIVQMLDILGCKKDIDIKTLSTQDQRNIDYLVIAFVDKKEVHGLKEDLPGIPSIIVGDLKFLLFMQKVEEKREYIKFLISLKRILF